MNLSKYRTILDAGSGELERLKEKSANDPWKPIYHIHPEFGLINDPNGLAYFNGEYHTFYQWYPYGPTHGMKHWAYVKSKDLVHWKRMPVALIPTEDYEKHGCYSGGAIVKDGQLFLYYTGNIKFGVASHERDANQCLAIMDKNGQILKYEGNPAIKSTPDGYTGHVRDPKVWQEGSSYYMILGAQRENETGTLLIYESTDAIEWALKGELKVNGLEHYGFMWECPDYFQLNGKDILVFSPQGIERQGHKYQNIYNVIYIVGKMDLNKLEFEVEYFQEMDKGFDFYAPQTFEDNQKRRLMFGWAGTVEAEYPTDENMWAHCLTLPRELRFDGGKFKQSPVKELEALRMNKLEESGSLTGEQIIQGFDGDAYELSILLSASNVNTFGFELFHSEKEGIRLIFDRQKQHISLDRSTFANQVKSEYGSVRTAEWVPTDEVNIRVFVDKSVVEIFINNGELVFTSRVFPDHKSKEILLFSEQAAQYSIIKYDLARGIK